jgi:ABC-type amino acid transport substrate-binding protein
MKSCSRCHHENPDDAIFCEKCGAQLSSGKKVLALGAITVLVALLIGGIIYVVNVVNRSGKPESVPIPPKGEVFRTNVLQAIKDAGVLRVAVESDAEPFNWKDEETGEEKGFECDLIKLIAKEMGVNRVQLIWSSDYDGIPDMISAEQNQADIFMGGYIANPKFSDVVWSDPYYETGYCLIIPDGSAIKSIKDLNGKKIGIYDEDDAEEFVKEIVTSPAAINRYDDEKHEGEDWLMIHLVEKQAKDFNEDLVDAAIYDYPFAKVVVANSEGELDIVEFNLNTFAYQIGLPKNNYELRTELNVALKKVINSPSYKELVIKYLNFNFDASLPETQKDVIIHVVESGETLSSIALKYCETSKQWKDIWEANKNRIPDFNLIIVGNKLIIPKSLIKNTNYL